MEEAAAQCDLWADLDKKLYGDDWLKKLKPCPCKKADALKPDFEPYPSDVLTHAGCEICYRTPFKPGSPLRSGQQCCYDKSGELITSGTGAGTPDFYHPIIVLNPAGHFINDVYPFLVCKKAGRMDKYWERRPPNKGDDGNGNACKDNPTKPLPNPILPQNGLNPNKLQNGMPPSISR